MDYTDRKTYNKRHTGKAECSFFRLCGFFRVGERQWLIVNKKGAIPLLRKFFSSLTILALIFLVTSVPAVASQGPADLPRGIPGGRVAKGYPTDYVPGQVIVKFKESAGLGQKIRSLARCKGR